MTASRSHWKTHESCGSDDPVDGKNDDDESGCNRQQNILELINPAINEGPLSQHDAVYQGYFPYARVVQTLTADFGIAYKGISFPLIASSNL